MAPASLHVRRVHRDRAGFTLVELLIVVSIIAVLMALISGAAVQVIGVQRASNTEQLLKTLSSVFDRHWKEVVSQADKEAIPDNLRDPIRVMAGLSPTTDQRQSLPDFERRARVIWIKMRLRQEFPMTFAEALNPDPLPPKPAYKQALERVVADPNRTGQSSVCLLLSLQQSRGGIAFSPDSLGSGDIAESYCTKPPPVNQSAELKQLVDAWEIPLAFYRWPTAHDDLNPGGNPQRGFNDPQDREGLLTNKEWLASSPPVGRTWFNGSRGHILPDYVAPPRGPVSFKLMPVIVSAGKNKQLGIRPGSFDMSVANVDQANDNIYSNRVR